MNALWQAIVNFFRSVSGVVVADVKKLEAKVVALEQSLVAKVTAKVTDATPQFDSAPAETPTPPAA